MSTPAKSERARRNSCGSLSRIRQHLPCIDLGPNTRDPCDRPSSNGRLNRDSSPTVLARKREISWMLKRAPRMRPTILSSRFSVDSDRSVAIRAVNPRIVIVNRSGRRSGRYSASNGQLTNTLDANCGSALLRGVTVCPVAVEDRSRMSSSLGSSRRAYGSRARSLLICSDHAPTRPQLTCR